MKKVVAIILNWNKAEETLKLLNQLMHFEKDICDVIVVDNNSKPQERKKLIDFFLSNDWPIIEEKDFLKSNIVLSPGYLILLNRNYGYAKGNNYGLKLSNILGYKYSLISNNDIKLEIPVVEKLSDVLELDPSIALVGPKIIGPNGKVQGPFPRPGMSDQFWYSVFFPLFWGPRKLWKLIKKEKKLKAVIFPYRLMGCFMLVRNDIMKEIGYFDENTFLYAEELILAEKLRSKGYKTAYLPTLFVKHLHGLSTASLSDNKRFMIQLESDLYYFKNYRNYGKFKLSLVRIGRKVMFRVWFPIVQRIKKILMACKGG
ncbi:MAG: glycosyltransferase family 2 protein [Thermosipho sp. (in: Bacteria)]|nr:glycosyltransferase family 2 protein [Thermosipho sp. (in: thermotogales)]